MKQDMAMKKLLDFYLSPPPVAPTTTENGPSAGVERVETCIDCNAPNNLSINATCQTNGCKRKRTKECATGMCFQCCYNLKTPCSAHFRMRKKREEEDRYIEEGMRSSSKQKTSFYHYEEKFMKCNQTVVIWCLQDFLNRKEWSADTMAQYKREMRTQELLRRRHSLNSQLTDISHSNNGSSSSNISSSVAVATNSSSNRGGKNASYKTAATTSSSAGAKRGRQGKALTSATATSTATSSMHMNKAAKRFQKVKDMWQKKYKLSSL